MEDISAIVVTHNSEAEVGGCLDALRGCGQTLVVDNASSDGTVAQATRRSWVEVIANPDNRGFAAAVNQGARVALGRYLLILNPDAVLTTSCDDLMAACEESGIAAGCLTEDDGTAQVVFAVRRLPTVASLTFECLGLNAIWPRNPVNVRYRCLDLDLSRPCRVEQPAGAFLMVRRDVFRTLGGFDEQFWPIWYEDVDFCHRALTSGYSIEYRPAARARHSGGHSILSIQPKFKRIYWYGSLLKYTGKYHGAFVFRTVCGSIIVGSLARISAGMMRGRGDLKGEYLNVLRLAAASLLAGRFVYLAAEAQGDDSERLESHPLGR